jgi:hypothetical protein
MGWRSAHPARLAGRAWRLARDLGAASMSVARVLSFAVRPPADRPGLALLAGEPLAFPGAPNTYRVRVYNPTATPQRFVLRVRGSCAAPERAFDAAADLVLGPAAAAERWVRSRWEGDGTITAEPPGDGGFAWRAGAGGERWTLEASLAGEGGRLQDMLRIGGLLRA